jgi:hypothetical protein
MRAGTATRIRQLLLLCALALAVVGMHHVVLAPHETMSCGPHSPGGTHATHMAFGDQPPTPSVHTPGSPATGGHDMLHLCLAVLGASGGLLLLLALLALAAGGMVALPLGGLRLPPGRARRPASTTGRSLLASVCVLRI